MPDQHIESAEAEVANNLDPLQRLHVGMHVADAHAVLVQIFGQVLGHALGQRGDERAIASLRHLAHFAQKVVHLAPRGPDLDRRVDQPGRPDDLLGENAAGAIELPAARRRRDAHGLRPHQIPFLEAERPVVHAGRQAETIFGKRGLAAKIAAIHAADLRDRDVALVDEDQRVVGQILEQRRRRLAGFAAGQVARIVFDAGAGASRLDHLHIKLATLRQTLRLEQPPRLLKLLQPPLQLLANALDRLLPASASA